MKKALLISFLFFILALSFILFLTQGIPVHGAEIWNHKLFSIDKHLDDFFRIGTYKFDMEIRPLNYLRYQFLIPLIGYSSFVFHLSENIPFAVLIALIFFLCYKYTGNFWVGAGSALFYMINPVIYFAVGPNTLNLDILTQLLLLIAAMVFLEFYLNTEKYRNKGMGIFLQALMLFLIFLANNTKPSAKLIPFVILFFILANNLRRIKEFAAFLTLAMIIVVPVQPLLYLLGLPLKTDIAYNYLDEPGKVIRFLIYTNEYPSHYGPTLLFTIGIPFAILLIASLIYIFKNKRPLQVLESKTRVFASFFAFSFICNIVGMCITPYTRSPYYLNGILVSTAILMTLVLYWAISLINSSKARDIFIRVIFITFIATICSNGIKVLIIRGGHVSYFIAQENIGRYFEKNIRNALILGEVELFTQSRLNLKNSDKWAPPGYSEEQLKKIVGHPLDSGNIYMMMENYINIDGLINDDLERLKEGHPGYSIYLVKRGELKIDPAIKTEFVDVIYPRTDTLYDYFKDMLPFMKIRSRHVYNIYKVIE